MNIQSELDRILGGTYDLLVLDKVLVELSDMINRGGKLGRNAKHATEFLERTAQTIMLSSLNSSSISTDEMILKYALENSCVVATNDQPLRERLRNVGIPVITARGPGKLFIDGYIPK